MPTLCNSFAKWILYKIVFSVRESFQTLGAALPEDLGVYAVIGAQYLHDLQTGGETTSPPSMQLAASELLVLLER